MVVKFNFLSKYLGMQTNVTMCLPSFSFADVMSDRKEVYVQGMKYQTLYLLHGGSRGRFGLRELFQYRPVCGRPQAGRGDALRLQRGIHRRAQGPEIPEIHHGGADPPDKGVFPAVGQTGDTFVGGLSMGCRGGYENCPHLPGAVFGSADHVGRCKASGHPEAGFPLCHAENGAGAR